MKKIFCAILCAACLASAFSAQEGESKMNRADVLKNAPSVSRAGKVTFTLTAPKASEVMLGGDWGGERLPMIKDEKGNWILSIQLKPQIYSYYFLVDGVKTLDPANTKFKLGRLDSASSIEVPGNPPMLWEMRNVPHGQVTSITYNSTASGDQRRVTIYTPPGYQPDQAAKLPVLYLLHGNGDIESSWVQYGRANLIADNLLAEGRMKPMIIVMPKGHAYKPGETEIDGVRPPSVFEEDLLKTIMPLVEKRFQVKTDQPNRAIMGLSMGGGQSFSIGMSHLDLFSHVGIFSSSGIVDRDSELLARLAADPTSANEKLKMLWISCGRLDPRFKSVQKLTADLTKAGIHHTYQPSDGAHDWINWREYLTETLPLLFQQSDNHN
jgi:enterochelin esterase-like enzyme